MLFAYAILEELGGETRSGYLRHFTLRDDVLWLLTAYSWPGNVRELRNTLERALMLSDSERIDARCPRSSMPAAPGRRLPRRAMPRMHQGPRRITPPRWRISSAAI